MSEHDRAALTALADGRLDGASREAAEAHATGCPSCRATFDSVVLARRALRATATFPQPSQQAYFRLRYAVASRRRQRFVERLLAAAVVVLEVGMLLAAARFAFGG